MEAGKAEEEVMACGIICRECTYYRADCEGCRAVKGAPFWVAFVGVDCCPIYECCVVEKRFDHCGQCDDLPCERFTRFRDPTVSEENAARTLESMVARLKEMEQSGE
ncbi:MAG TPA: DUF3795 domain-containing protein [Methanoregulaceae archaeon]|nr:DUF3795 domain-containing protein [Methanoregulaceae archaeon]